MIARHIHHALAQVQELQQRILEKQRFKGYSGRARAVGGTVALVAAIIMASPRYPLENLAHFIGWGIVFVAAVSLNYGALIYWFLFDPEVKRDLRRLRPVLDLFPPLFVGAMLTLVFYLHGDMNYLQGIWMCLFGLANFATRHVVPKAIIMVGIYYVAAGTALLLTNRTCFTNPWPMGLVFFIGEWIGGLILHYDGNPWSFFESFFRKKEDA